MHNLQLRSRKKLHDRVTTHSLAFDKMEGVFAIPKSKQPVRRHFIPEWADHRSLKQSDIAKAIGVDKSVVSRWFAGNIPSEKWIDELAAVMGTDVPGLFRSPDEDRLIKVFSHRTSEERKRMLQVLETAFPQDA